MVDGGLWDILTGAFLELQLQPPSSPEVSFQSLLTIGRDTAAVSSDQGGYYHRHGDVGVSLWAFPFRDLALRIPFTPARH